MSSIIGFTLLNYFSASSHASVIYRNSKPKTTIQPEPVTIISVISSFKLKNLARGGCVKWQRFMYLCMYLRAKRKISTMPNRKVPSCCVTLYIHEYSFLDRFMDFPRVMIVSLFSLSLCRSVYQSRCTCWNCTVSKHQWCGVSYLGSAYSWKKVRQL